VQIVTSWMRTGIEQGIEQGKHEGELSIVMRLLKRKVGKLNLEIETQVRALSVAQLEELSEALLDFSNVDDLTTWLQP
jgi:predicted transposase YdaD